MVKKISHLNILYWAYFHKSKGQNIQAKFIVVYMTRLELWWCTVRKDSDAQVGICGCKVRKYTKGFWLIYTILYATIVILKWWVKGIARMNLMICVVSCRWITHIESHAMRLHGHWCGLERSSTRTGPCVYNYPIRPNCIGLINDFVCL